MNAELCKKALEKVGTPNILINIVSRRVRQLNAGSRCMGRPLIADYTNLGAADIALREIIEEKNRLDHAGDRRTSPSCGQEAQEALSREQS